MSTVYHELQFNEKFWFWKDENGRWVELMWDMIHKDGITGVRVGREVVEVVLTIKNVDPVRRVKWLRIQALDDPRRNHEFYTNEVVWPFDVGVMAAGATWEYGITGKFHDDTPFPGVAAAIGGSPKLVGDDDVPDPTFKITKMGG